MGVTVVFLARGIYERLSYYHDSSNSSIPQLDDVCYRTILWVSIVITNYIYYIWLQARHHT